MVVDSPSVYNTIIDRETLHALWVVASTYYMLLKFPTVNGIGVVGRAQMVSRETYEITTAIRSRQQTIPGGYHNSSECMEVGSVDYGCIMGAIQLGNLDPKDKFYEQRGSPVEEFDEIPFDPDEPGRTFKIGKLLREPLRIKLVEFLRAHKEVFQP